MSSLVKSSISTKRLEETSAAFIRPSRATYRLRQARSPENASSRPCCPPSTWRIPRSMCGPRSAIAARSSRMSRGAEHRLDSSGRRPRNRPSRLARLAGILSCSSSPRGIPGRLAEASRSTPSCGEPLIVRESGSGSRCALEKSLERASRSLAELNVSLELGSNVAIKDAVKRGLGVAFLSRFCVRGSWAPKSCERSLSGASASRGISISSTTGIGRCRRRRASFCTSSNRIPSVSTGPSGHKAGLWPSHHISEKPELPILRGRCTIGLMFDARRKQHWEAVYQTKGETNVSWYQDEPRLSLELIRAFAPTEGGRIIDVGGGASVLVDRLLELPFERNRGSRHLRDRLGQSNGLGWASVANGSAGSSPMSPTPRTSAPSTSGTTGPSSTS